MRDHLANPLQQMGGGGGEELREIRHGADVVNFRVAEIRMREYGRDLSGGVRAWLMARAQLFRLFVGSSVFRLGMRPGLMRSIITRRARPSFQSVVRLEMFHSGNIARNQSIMTYIIQ